MDPDHERMEDIDAGRKRKRILTSSGECSPASERDIPDDVYQDRSEDDPDDVDSQDEGFIDDTEQGVAHRPSFDPSVSPAPEPSQGQSESSDDDGDTPTGSPEPDSLYAKSNNNLSRSLRMVHALEYCELTETEGTPLFWLSESVGPSIPAMAMQQILCLQHLLNFPLNGDHIMSNQFLEVLWMAGKGRGKKARALEKLVYHMDLKDSEIQRRQRNRARYQDATIDDYPENFYCNFSAAPGASKVASVMSFADILLAPCVASYKSRSTGAGMRKVFWLVILKTRIVYNVCAHLCDFLKQKDSAGLDFASQRRAEDVYLLWKEIILHQHSMSPSVIAMCKKQHIVPANPMLNLDQAGEPDSLMACCNVFEVYRAMKQRCMAQGADSVDIPGFTESVKHSTTDSVSWQGSIQAYSEWKARFDGELAAAKKKEEDMARASKRGGQLTEEMEDSLKEQDLGTTVELSAPGGWPVLSQDDEWIPGIPHFPIVMLVHAQGVFQQESSLSEFRSSFGDLPARATMELTKMMYQEDEAVLDDPGFANRFLPPSRIMTEYDRLVTYTLAMNDMRGFYVAGHHSELLMRNLRYLQDNVQDNAQRVVFYSKYLRDCLRQHRSIVTNGNMRNKHAEFQMKYIVEAEGRLLRDLAALRSRAFTSVVQEGVSSSNDPLLRDWNSRTCWLMQSPDSFLFFLWEHQELYKSFNSEFVNMTPANLFICQSVIESTVMYRMGHGNPNYTRMGMCNSVMNAAGKLLCAVDNSKKKMNDVRKVTGAGLDYVNMAVNLFRMMYKPYLNMQFNGDKQKIRTIRRTTEGSLYDYVTFMEGKIINAPSNVGEDTAMTEGPSARRENLEGLFNQIDRDDDPHNSIMNTVDLNNTNNRKQTTAEPLAGWKLFLVLLGVNNMFDAQLQTRYQQMLIACNPICASAPNDTMWNIRNSSGDDASAALQQHDQDSGQLHRGGVNRAAMPTGKMKGNTPDDFQQSLWAPFMYFVPGIAGTCIGISNKLGSWTLPINYACKGVCDMVYTVVTQHLSCLIDDEDQRNSPRYFEGLKCRMVARTILIKTHQCLCHAESLEDAQVKAVQSLNVNGMHICLVVPLCHQLVQRLVKFGPLLCLSTFMPYLRLPVVSIRSILQLLDGQRISDPKDYTMVRDFINRSLDSGSFLPFRETPDGRSVPERNITPYLGSYLQNRDSSVDDDSQTSELRRTFPTPTDRPASLEALRQIGVAVFRRNSDVLKQCSFVQDESSFVTLLGGVRDAVYDLRGLFGGMSCYENSRQLVSVATGRTADGMPTCFENNHSSAADPMFVIRQTTCNKNEYALGVRVWDALLFAALIRRPRRDYGIVYDFSLSITEFVLSAFPASVLPFQRVPTLRLDPLSGDQMLARVGVSQPHQGPRCDRPEQVLRFQDARTAGRNAIFSCSSPGPTGLVEDDCFMSSIIALKETLRCTSYQHIPLARWSVDIHWQWGVVYPMVRYCPEEGSETEDRPRAALVLNQVEVSMQLYVQDSRQAKLCQGLDIDELVGLRANMRLLAEFSVMPKAAGTREHVHVDESFFACQERLFRLGYGPIPLVRRPGVAVLVSTSMQPDPEDELIGCIVPHHQRNGCRCPKHRRCYFCVENPFYEVCFAPYDGGRVPYRFFAEYLVAAGVVLRPGSELLLRVDAPGLVEVFPPSQHGPIQRSEPQRPGSPDASQAEAPYDILLRPDSQVATSQASQAPGDSSVGSRHLVCWLQVPSSITPRDGLLAVSIRCRYGPDTSQFHTVLVTADYLHRAKDRTETDACRQYVYGPPRRAGAPA